MNEALMLWLMASENKPDIEALLAELVNRPAWHRDAACRGVGSDLFFPERGSKRFDEALTYCQRCPVTSECLAAALEDPRTKGVWGGLSERGRRVLRRGSAA